MKSIAAAILLCLAPSMAAAGDCQPKEYAQYKDNAKTPFGRTLLALDHCTARKLAPLSRTAKERAECDAVISRTFDAIMDRKDTKRAKWANDGCPDPAPQ